MESRPKIILQLYPIDKFLETAASILLSLMWCLAVYTYYLSPSIIPVHYTLSGKPDSYGTRWTLFLGPAIATAVFALLTFLNKYPHIFNYAVEINNENAPTQYRLATRMLRFLKLSVVIIVIVVTGYEYLSTKGFSNGPGLWFVPFVFIITSAPTIVLVVKSFRTKNS